LHSEWTRAARLDNIGASDLAKNLKLLLVVAAVLVGATTATRYVAMRRQKTVSPGASAHEADSPGPTTIPPELSKSLLDQMRTRSDTSGAGADNPQRVPTNSELEASYAIVAELDERVGALKAEIGTLGRAGQEDAAAQKLSAVKEQIALLDDRLAAFQGELGKARGARPDDPIIEWLTGELLMLVGGEPEEILPHFEKATRAGIQRRSAWISMARVQLEANHFDAAYRSAAKGLEASGSGMPDRKALDVFGGAGIATGHFEEVAAQIARAFPNQKPAWAEAIQRRAQDLQDQWVEEQRIRHAEEAAGGLPRVRLTIEHQSFGQSADGNGNGKPVAKGREDVDLDLYPRQAPATVANFLKLVQQGFYDGTRFHWAEAASMVVGGDPNTKNDDPDDDGLGGPGYVIADEFKKPDARLHFRGSIAMVESAANTAGSQFFIELVPHPEMNHHITVFGRVVRGQDAVDRITPGRTNQRFGRFGKIIPGDLIVRARVLRK
jgi:peptidyl-prolyl cis-trans isomerase B (cyclophilin B)